MAELNEEKSKRKQRDFMFHVLRNPYGWSDEVVREMRLKAADELDHLYYFEESVRLTMVALNERVGL